jgi:hypothetical protein
LFTRHGSRVGIRRVRAEAHQAELRMIGKQFQAARIECRASGGDLAQNTHPVSVFINHALNADDLPSDPVCTALDLVA